MTIDKAILAELHLQGFKRDFHARAGGGEIIIYVLRSGVRTLELQIWSDGNHRVSHFLGGRMSTPPSDFHTVDEMKIAITHELTRTDHPLRSRDGKS